MMNVAPTYIFPTTILPVILEKVIPTPKVFMPCYILILVSVGG